LPARAYVQQPRQPQWARLHEPFPFIAQLLHELPAKPAVLDGEVVASR
jgi:hypothetical protein